MDIGFAIDDAQGLTAAEELRLVELGSELGYHSAWTPSRADATAFDRCIAWHAAGGLPVGISAVPASAQPAAFYAEHAGRVWEATKCHFTLVVGSGRAERAAKYMRGYLADLRPLLPAGMALYVAALGPRMLELGGELADGVALNWCTAPQLAWSRDRVTEAARAAGRATPSVVEYIRTCVDPDHDLARRTVGEAARSYALGPAAYRRHFERMGFGDEVRRLERSANEGEVSSLSSVGAAGTPGNTRAQFAALTRGLDLPIVRILAVKNAAFASARRALEECRPR